ncbi:transmembrane protein 151B-like [Daktulosphaira vitifoliae]|uniref:transmembrane protein 151B-like n=1 Tax=Daktulosphaira vitifoliae TaxID=58002 RepID=UPI0021AA0F07|nr:transmembrane protein 151B-like [Daktulosphaira vitifoliae]
MPFIPEQYQINTQYVRDTKLSEAFQWKETWKCFTLTIIIVIYSIGVLRDPSNIGLTKGSSLSLEYIYCVLGCLFLYILYLVECRYSEIVWDLAETEPMPLSALSEYIVRLKRAEPHVWWQASCYHYTEPKLTRRRNLRQLTRVNMHVARVSFDHRNFGHTDISDYLIFHQRSPLVKIEFSKGFAFARPRHAEEFESARNEFFSAHESIDEHMEKKEGMDLAGVEFDEYISAGRFPRLVNTITYWLCSFLLLSWPYRVYVNYNTSYASYTVTKLFGQVRMIPSYSETMLIDPAPPAYVIDCPSPFDMYEMSQTMTIFRTCSPNYVPTNLVRYIESGPYAFPPSYEEALMCPSFEPSSVDIDNRSSNNNYNTHGRSTGGRYPAAVTFETSL